MCSDSPEKRKKKRENNKSKKMERMVEKKKDDTVLKTWRSFYLGGVIGREKCLYKSVKVNVNKEVERGNCSDGGGTPARKRASISKAFFGSKAENSCKPFGAVERRFWQRSARRVRRSLIMDEICT